jgi:hypothetical protein
MGQPINFVKHRHQQARHEQLVNDAWLIKDMDVREIMEKYKVSKTWACTLRVRSGGKSRKAQKRMYTDDELTDYLQQMLRKYV